MSDNLRDFDKKNEVPKHKIDLTDEITRALGINGVYVSVGLTNKEIHLNKLDFSEHDKVFEDKIARLEKENKALNSYLVQREQDSTDMIMELKQRIAELEQSRSEWIDKAVEWQQKCEKLESKESVKPMRIEFHADNGEMLTPLEVANSLINLGYERPLKENEVSTSGKNSIRVNTFSVNDLKEIADYLNVYSRHHQKDTETISF